MTIWYLDASINFVFVMFENFIKFKLNQNSKKVPQDKRKLNIIIEKNV